MGRFLVIFCILKSFSKTLGQETLKLGVPDLYGVKNHGDKLVINGIVLLDVLIKVGDN